MLEVVVLDSLESLSLLSLASADSWDTEAMYSAGSSPFFGGAGGKKKSYPKTGIGLSVHALTFLEALKELLDIPYDCSLSGLVTNNM